MGEYEFEIQALIKVKQEGSDNWDARSKLTDRLYDIELLNELMNDASLSNGKLVKEKNK